MEQYSGLPASNSPVRVEPPSHLVGVKAVPNMVAGTDGSLANSGKAEVRMTNPCTKGVDKKVDWQKTAYMAAHEALYAYQYARDKDVRIEELERAYSKGLTRFNETVLEVQESRRELTTAKAILDVVFHMRDTWMWFLVPRKVRFALFPMEGK
jgi:hypothetical protein